MTQHYPAWFDESFGHLSVNKARHETFNDKFNPYRNRRATHQLNETLFNTMCLTFPNGCSVVLDSFFDGCLDAPDEIPMGSTLCIDTIGGYRREEYNKLPRGTEDWKARLRAEAEVAKFLAEILAGIDES